MVKKSLEPAPKPINVNVWFVIVMIFAFALFFAILGVWGMHYPKIASVI